MKTIIQITISLLLFQGISFAQTIDIYRSGTKVKTISGILLTLKTAVDSSLSGDSLVLSPHTFLDRGVKIDKDLIIQGTHTMSDSTIIEQATTKASIFYIFSKSVSFTKVIFRDIIVQNASLIRSLDSIALDSLYGAGIKAFENTDVTITGNSIFRNCSISLPFVPFTSYKIDSTLYGGIAIYSRGKLTIKGNTKFTNNYSHEIYGGAILSLKELNVSDSVQFINNVCGAGGGAIAASGIVNLRDRTKIINNYCVAGGSGKDFPLYRHVDGGGVFICNGTLNIEDSTQIIGNTSKDKYKFITLGGGVSAINSIVNLKNKSAIANNSNNGIYLFSSTLNITDSAIVALNFSENDYGAGIYNKGGTINIESGQIVGNYCLNDTITRIGMAIYNDTILGRPAPNVKINNARIFNPTQDFKRTVELYNETGTDFHSDSTWWGESDTSNLIVNKGSASTTLGSWIVADWSINKGIPIASDTTFPIDAYFKLNSGSAIPPKMFWMLKGLYVCDYGKFKPDTADMLSSNYISTQYTSSDTTRLVSILATVDADSFKNIQTITGLSISNNKLNNQLTQYKLYPNPISDFIKIKSSNKNEKCNLLIVDLTGKICYQNKVMFYENEATINLSLVNGSYILAITNQNNSTQYFNFLVTKK